MISSQYKKMISSKKVPRKSHPRKSHRPTWVRIAVIPSFFLARPAPGDETSTLARGLWPGRRRTASYRLKFWRPDCTLKPLFVPGSAGGKGLTRNVHLTTPQVLHLSIVVQLPPLFQSELRGITVLHQRGQVLTSSSQARLAPLR